MTDSPLLLARRRVAALARSLQSAQEQLGALPAGRRRLMDDWAQGLAQRVREDRQAAVFDNETVNRLCILDGKGEGLPELIDTIKDRLAHAATDYALAQVDDLTQRQRAGEPVAQRLRTWTDTLHLLRADPAAVLTDVLDHALRGEGQAASMVPRNGRP